MSSEDYGVPTFRKWSTKQLYEYNEIVADYETLEELGRAINAARVALFKVTDKINEDERSERASKMNYDRAWRRAYLESVDKTEAQKRIRADLKCENLENDYVLAEQLKNELNRTSHALRLELQTLQAIGNNLRQQMKME